MSEESEREAEFIRAAAALHSGGPAILFVTPLLRAREIKLAAALRHQGWKVVLIYVQTTPFHPSAWFDAAIQAESHARMHELAKAIQPPLCHVFSGAVDEATIRFCEDKPAPLVIDMNDVFSPSLFNHCQERFEPTRACLAQADAYCARDLQPKFAERYDGFRLPERTILFPEYPWGDNPSGVRPESRNDDEVRVVSVGTFCLESQGHYDSAYLQIARMLCEARIHFHIYPHWFYRSDKGSIFNYSLRNDFRDFFSLAEETPYLHMHDCKSLDDLAQELPLYDFGIVSGASVELGQHLGLVTDKYMRSCYSGRIADYIDARLPMLINHEVFFNYRLLERRGIVAELKELLRPGFRDRLLEMKRDPALADRVEETARELHLYRQAPRLARFYQELRESRPVKTVVPVDTRHLFAGKKPPPPTLVDFLARLRRWMRAAPIVVELVAKPITTTREIIRLRAQTGEMRAQMDEMRGMIAHLRERREADIETSRLRNLEAAETIQRLGQENAGMREVLETIRRADRSDEDLDVRTESATPGTDMSRERSLYNLALKNLALTRHVEELEARLGLARSETLLAGHSIDNISGWLNWPDIRDEVRRLNGFSGLVGMMSLAARDSGIATQPSRAWQVLNEKSLSQLLTDGYANFKRTIGCSYFNFPVQAGDPQIVALEKLLPREEVERCRKLAESLPDDPGFRLGDQRFYRYFVAMLWRYTRRNDARRILDDLAEPEEGNPVVVPVDGERATQDLANSVLEYSSIAESVNVDNLRRVLEIGGGYGRDAFVFLSRHPELRYVMVDIPPALFLSQRYLMSIFPHLKAFPSREFTDFASVREEIEEASIVFLLPHQLALLPNDWFDLAINISSFGEMSREQFSLYFDQINRTTRGSFYSKQWKLSKNPFDNLELTAGDYPIPDGWMEVSRRECAVQVEFFEALYRTGERTNV